MKIPVHVNKNVKKQICSLVQKVDLIEQNQCDFWIQHIKIILNQLKNLNNKFGVDQCYSFQDQYNNTCNSYLSVSYHVLVLPLFLPYPLLSLLAAFSIRLNFMDKFIRNMKC